MRGREEGEEGMEEGEVRHIRDGGKEEKCAKRSPLREGEEGDKGREGQRLWKTIYRNL